MRYSAHMRAVFWLISTMAVSEAGIVKAEQLPCAKNIESIGTFYQVSPDGKTSWGLGMSLGNQGQHAISKIINGRYSESRINTIVAEKTFSFQPKDRGDGVIYPQLEILIDDQDENAANFQRKKVIEGMPNCRIIIFCNGCSPTSSAEHR